MPAGEVRKMSLAVLVDQTVSWEKDEQRDSERVLTPPPPEKLKVDPRPGGRRDRAQRGSWRPIDRRDAAVRNHAADGAAAG